MILAGILYVIWVITDPTFVPLIALFSNTNNILILAFGFGIWMIIGQLSLYILTLALTVNAHGKVIRKTNIFLDKNNRREKLSKLSHIFIQLLLLGLGIYFLIKPILFLTKGVWI